MSLMNRVRFNPVRVLAADFSGVRGAPGFQSEYAI
jgi:hypothetical protein